MQKKNSEAAASKFTQAPEDTMAIVSKTMASSNELSYQINGFARALLGSSVTDAGSCSPSSSEPSGLLPYLEDGALGTQASIAAALQDLNRLRAAFGIA